MGFVLHGVEWMKQLSKLARFKASDISKTLRPIIKIACMAHFLLCAMGFILLQKNMYSALAAVFLFTPLVVAMGAVATALMKLNTAYVFGQAFWHGRDLFVVYIVEFDVFGRVF